MKAPEFRPDGSRYSRIVLRHVSRNGKPTVVAVRVSDNRQPKFVK